MTQLCKLQWSAIQSHRYRGSRGSARHVSWRQLLYLIRDQGQRARRVLCPPSPIQLRTLPLPSQTSHPTSNQNRVATSESLQRDIILAARRDATPPKCRNTPKSALRAWRRTQTLVNLRSSRNLPRRRRTVHRLVSLTVKTMKAIHSGRYEHCASNANAFLTMRRSCRVSDGLACRNSRR